jgi:hypothetical protein
MIDRNKLISINYLTYGGAFPLVFAIFALCQTILLGSIIGKPGVVFLMGLVMLLSLIVIFLFHQKFFFNAFRSSKFWIAALSISVCGALYLEINLAINNFIKLFYIAILAHLASARGFNRALIVGSDLVFGIVVIVFVLALNGVIPSEVFETVDRIKYTGGFNNPNTGPFFLVSSFLIYVAFGLWRRASLVCFVLIFIYFKFDISSTTLTASSVMVLMFWGFMRLMGGRFLSLSLAFLLITLLSLGGGVYLSPFLAPGILNDHVGGLIDLALSYRLWILSNDFILSNNSFVGFVLQPIDSAYVEIIYFAGPPFFVLVLLRLIGVISFKKSVDVLGIQLFLLGFLVAGFAETLLFTLTPISLFFVNFLFKGISKCDVTLKPPAA